MKRSILTAIAMLVMAMLPAYTSAQQLSPHAAIAAKAKAPQAVTLSAYLTVDPATLDRDALEQLGVNVSLDLGSTLTAMLPIASLDALKEVEGVEYVQVATPVSQMLDIARPEVGMEMVHSGTSLELPFTGKGVVVGIVDSGYDYGHNAFRDADGNLRIVRVWEQTAKPTGSLTSPEGFGYGVEMTTAADILHAEGDIRNNSHGSHVTSIAAGSDSYLDGALRGMAPEADIVLVSMLNAGGGNVNISDAVAYIFRYADEVGKPCVVNLSLGNHKGPHDGTSTFDVIADALQGPGRLIVGAAGNHTTHDFHINHTFADADEAPLRTFVEYRQSPSLSNTGGEIEVWAEKDSQVEIALCTVKTTSGEIVERVVVWPSESTDASSVSLGRNISGTFEVAAETSPLNGKPHVLLSSAVTSIRNGYAIALEVKPLGASTIDIWADDNNLGLSSRDIEGFSAPTDDDSTISEIGGTARRILTVGAYTTRNEYTLLGETTPRKLDETNGDISSFSNYGPTSDGRIKPQVAAPGCFISAAVSQFDASGTTLYSHYYEGANGHNYYGYMQGTSMSSPLMAGIVATWLQAWPEMTPEDLVDIVKSTVRTDAFTGQLPQGDSHWGYGKVDALAGLKEAIARSQSGSVGSIGVGSDGAPAAVSIHGDAATVIFTAAAATATVEIYNAQGQRLAARTLTGIASGQTLNLPLPDGLTLLRVTTPAATSTTKLRP